MDRLMAGLNIFNESPPSGYIDVHLIGSQHLSLLHEQLLLSLQLGLARDHRIQEFDLLKEKLKSIY